MLKLYLKALTFEFVHIFKCRQNMNTSVLVAFHPYLVYKEIKLRTRTDMALLPVLSILLPVYLFPKRAVNHH